MVSNVIFPCIPLRFWNNNKNTHSHAHTQTRSVLFCSTIWKRYSYWLTVWDIKWRRQGRERERAHGMARKKGSNPNINTHIYMLACLLCIARSPSNTESMINNCVLFSLIQFFQCLFTIFSTSSFCSNASIKIKCQANQRREKKKHTENRWECGYCYFLFLNAIRFYLCYVDEQWWRE